MEFLKGIFAYNDYEKKLLSQDGDSSLIKKNSKLVNLSNGQTLRIVSVTNDHARKIGTELSNELPLILFIHGLGGQLNQFEFLIDTFSYFASVVAVDQLGHGQSSYTDDWKSYTTTNLVADLQEVLRSDQVPAHKGVFIIGHSMGSIVGLRLAQSLPDCVGIACVTPPWTDDPERLERLKRWLYWVPTLLFDIFRAWGRVGGIESQSVRSFVSSKSSSPAIRERQLRTNLQSVSKTWLRIVYGFEFLHPDQLQVGAPIICISAEDDHVCPPNNVQKFAEALRKAGNKCVEYKLVHNSGHAVIIEKPEVLSALICAFIQQNVDERLSLAWQLQHIASKSDKWSLKNESKWRETQNVGAVVKNSRFRGMKTLRQDDPDHNPATLEKNFPDICAIIDISREAPPYDPSTFTRIKYYKFPTVSKIPPSREEVAKFVELVDSIKCEGTIGVHCHYGFNRTGFLICSYLLETTDMSVQDAIRAFEDSRPSGIHHIHFIDELYVRYEG